MALPFLLLPLIIGTLAVASFRRDLKELRRVRIGGVDENLSRARALLRRSSLAALILLTTLIGLAMAGERWAAEWRQSIVAIWVLNALILVLAAGLLRGAWRTIHNQWARDGTYGGMFIGMAEQSIFLILLVAAVYWRGGLA
jgi:hypothetical protein